MKSIGLAILLLASVFGYSQQVTLNGRVSIHNSKYETGKIQYVDNANVSASFTKPANSDANGNFTLEFVGFDPGTEVSLKAEKSGLELVNDYDLKRVVIGRKKPLRIYLTEKGKLAEAQVELYNISKQSLFKREKEYLDRLKKSDEESQKAIAELEAFFGYPINDRFQAEQQLMMRIDALEKQLPEFALELASTNLDFASDLHIKAYETLKAGDIEKAIEVLDSASLEKVYQNAKKSIAEGNKLKSKSEKLLESADRQLEQYFESLIFKANAHYYIFEYKESAAIFERLVQLYIDHKVDPLRLAKMYDESATLSYLLGKYNKALQYQLKALQIKRPRLKKDEEELYISINMLAQIHRQLKNFDDAYEFQSQVVQAYEKMLDPLDPELAIAYNNLSLILLDQGEFEPAYNFQVKAQDIRFKSLDSIHPAIARGYSILGDIFKQAGVHDKALEYETMGLELKKQIHGPDHPELWRSYSGLSEINRILGEYDKAFELNEKALKIAKSYLGNEHHHVAAIYGDSSEILEELNRLEDALQYQFNALEIRLKISEEPNSQIARSYSLISKYYGRLGDYANALSYADKSIAISENIESPDYKTIATSYYNLGIIYQEMKDFEKAIEAHNKALEIRKKEYSSTNSLLGYSHYRIAQVYKEMGDYKKGIKHLKNAVSIDEANLPAVHPYLAEDYMEMSGLYVLLKDDKNALTYFNMASGIIQQIKPANRGQLEEKLKLLSDQIKSFKD